MSFSDEHKNGRLKALFQADEIPEEVYELVKKGQLKEAFAIIQKTQEPNTQDQDTNDIIKALRTSSKSFEQ